MSELNKVINACQYMLNHFPEAQKARDYLNDRLSKDSQNNFQFGYFPTANQLHVLTELLDENILKQTKLLYYKDISDALYPRSVAHSYFEHHNLIMPYKNQYGQTVAIVGRTLLNDKERTPLKIPKYKNTHETNLFKKSNLLFGLFENKQNILDKNEVYIVEGQFDVIKASEFNLNNTVALGTGYITPYQFSLITRYTNNINLLLDNDETGEKSRKKIMSKYSKFANIKNLYVKYPYKDIDEYFKNNTLVDFDEKS
jgi:DNA primase